MIELKGFKTKKKLKHWDSLCEEWTFIIEKYCRLTEEGDAPFIFKERANIGILAGAAWRCGRVALEEFRKEKVGKGDSWTGRADLWISTDNFKEELIEAKFDWLSLEARDPAKVASDNLLKAYDDAVDTQGGECVRSIGVAFLALYVKNGETKDLQSLVDSTIAIVKKQTNWDAIAWCCPKEQMIFHDYDDGTTCPGVIMLAKVVD